MKLYLDEHVHPGIALGLRARGFDVLTVQEAGKRGVSDKEHLEFAKLAKRIIVTSDQDFLRLSTKGHQHSGIIFITSPAAPIGDIIRALENLSAFLSQDDMKNHVEFV